MGQLSRHQELKCLHFINTIVIFIYKETNMTVHFVYIWFDKSRKMFYIGQHSGSIHDNYISSSRWLSSEVRYRPDDFRRKVIKLFDTKNEAQKYEAYLMSFIKDGEFGRKYYNMKNGREKGITPWNKGRKNVFSEDSLEKMSNAKKGRENYWKGKSNPLGAINGKKSAEKQSKTVTGRRIATRPDGTRYWIYPESGCLDNKEQPENPHSITAC